LTAAAAFIAINYTLSKLAQYLERRLSRRGEKPIAPLDIESGMGSAAAGPA
jgi:hypothetical protein